MSTPKTRRRPNILVTGTPGTGKSTIAPQLAENFGFRYIDVAKEVKERGFVTEFDEKRNCHVLDEDKLLDYLEDYFGPDDGGVLCDYHASELFPKRWFDFVIVLRCNDTRVLYDRLMERGYGEQKVKENIECEIFGTVAEEAQESYDESTVHEFVNETREQMADNIRRITQMVAEWKRG